jgi:hypothetical protein
MHHHPETPQGTLALHIVVELGEVSPKLKGSMLRMDAKQIDTFGLVEEAKICHGSIPVEGTYVRECLLEVMLHVNRLVVYDGMCDLFYDIGHAGKGHDLIIVVVGSLRRSKWTIHLSEVIKMETECIFLNFFIPMDIINYYISKIC